jgi:peptide/nickel transport system substrate-binding protein
LGWAPIPPGTPNRDLGRRPVPSTGPYRIESYVRKRTLTLVRNPYFRVWSRIASPDGFPDRIVIRLSVGAKAGVAAKADVAAVVDLVGVFDECRADHLCDHGMVRVALRTDDDALGHEWRW